MRFYTCSEEGVNEIGFEVGFEVRNALYQQTDKVNAEERIVLAPSRADVTFRDLTPAVTRRPSQLT